jgi:hypothetical protein
MSSPRAPWFQKRDPSKGYGWGPANAAGWLFIVAFVLVFSMLEVPGLTMALLGRPIGWLLILLGFAVFAGFLWVVRAEADRTISSDTPE